MKKIFIIIVIFGSLWMGTSHGQVYQVIDLGPANDTGEPVAMNNSGWVTWHAPGYGGAWLYKNGEVFVVNSGIPRGISDSGIIVGDLIVNRMAMGGFMSQSNKTTIVWPGITETYPVINGAVVTGVNDSGTVIGNGRYEYSVHGSTYILMGGLYYQSGVVTNLHSIFGNDYNNVTITASAINNRGTIVGSVRGTSNNSGVTQVKSVAWFGTTSLPIDLGVANGGDVVAVSSDDRIIGFNTESWIWQNGTVQYIGRPPNGRPFHATSVNARGQVLGNGYEANGSPMLMIWQNGVFTALDNLLVGTNICYNFVVGGVINDSGQIAAICRIGDGSLWKAVLITEVPVPSIVKQPMSQTTIIGSTVYLRVCATNAPTSYQWYFGANTIDGATNASLVLTNVQTSNSGAYTVTISNQVGSVTSNPAMLNVILGLGITMVPAVNIGGNVGETYELDFINTFGPTDAWSPLATIAVTNSPQWYLDGSAIGQPQRFYRLVQHL